MKGVDDIVAKGRALLGENPALGEADFRHRIMQEIIAEDEAARPGSTSALAGSGAFGAVIMLFLLPVFLFRWLNWRGKLARYEADIAAAIMMLREEGFFPAVHGSTKNR